MLNGMAEDVRVFRGKGGDIERGFFESALHEARIRFVVRSAGIAQHPVTIGPLAEYEIWVSLEDEERARQVLDELLPFQQVEASEDEPLDVPRSGALRRMTRRPTDRERRVFLGISILLLPLAIYLLVPYRDASLWGIFAMLCSGLCFAASRRG